MEKHDEFLSVLENNKGIIYKIANAYSKDADDRKDLVQEIIFKLWKSVDTYNNQFKYSTWIYRVALNAAISFYRKEKSKHTIRRAFSAGIFNIAEEPANGNLEQNILLLNQFIAGLKELDRALLVLYLEDKSHKEIAEIMGISETNVSTKLGRIKAILKQKFLENQL